MAGAGKAPNRPDLEGQTVRGRNVRLRDAAYDRKLTQSKRGSHAAFTITPEPRRRQLTRKGGDA